MPACAESNREPILRRDRPGSTGQAEGALARIRTEPFALEVQRLDPPGRARAPGRTTYTHEAARYRTRGGANASRTRPLGFAIRAHRWMMAPWFLRAGDEDRTRLENLGKVSRHHAASPAWSECGESNSDHQGGGLRSDHQTALASEPVVGIEPRLSGTDRAHHHDASSGGAALGDRNPSQPIPTAARLHGVNGKECARAPLTSTSNPEVYLCARWTVRESNPHLCFARAASSRWTNSPWHAPSESNRRLSIWNRSGHHDLRRMRRRHPVTIRLNRETTGLPQPVAQ